MSVSGAFGHASEEQEEHRLGKAKNLREKTDQAHVDELERKYRDTQVNVNEFDAFQVLKKHDEHTAQVLEEKRVAWEKQQLAAGKELPAWYIKKHGSGAPASH